MSTPRSRRIVRRAVMVVAGVVLLLAMHVGSVAGILFAREADWVPTASKSVVADWYVTPAVLYATMAEGWPLSDSCFQLLVWSKQKGASRMGRTISE
jgi:hypothetical protein